MSKRADILVCEQGLAKSREMAKRYIMAGQIYNNDLRVDKPGQYFPKETKFEFRGTKLKYVSRGGLKLEKALEEFNINLEGTVAADFGASTGGFTDCMLQNGTKYVYAIDVGYNQLDYTLRVDDRVNVMERENIRYLDLDKIKSDIDIITIDVSFISLELILPKAFDLISDNGIILALIKPQFEVGKKQVGKGGIIRDEKYRIHAVEKIYDFVQINNFHVTGLTESPITGTKGNIEYIMMITKDGPSVDRLFF